MSKKAKLLKQLQSYGIEDDFEIVQLLSKKKDKKEKADKGEPVQKVHRDFLLKEMAWMSNDFTVEKKFKDTKMQSIAKIIEKLRKKEAKSRKMEKDEYQDFSDVKKRAHNVSKLVGAAFWDKVDKLVLFKHNKEYMEKHKQVMDRQLDFLVGQTEKYSSLLAEKMVDYGAEEGELNRREGEEDEGDDSSLEDLDFVSMDEEDMDIEGEEEHDMLEIDELNADNALSVEELQAKYGAPPQKDLATVDLGTAQTLDSGLLDEDLDFESMDEEDMDIEDEGVHNLEEVDELNADNELSVEELRAKYAGVPPAQDDDTSSPLEEDVVDPSTPSDLPSIDGDTDFQHQEEEDVEIKEEDIHDMREVDELNADNELSVEELRAKYANMGPADDESVVSSSNESDTSNESGVSSPIQEERQWVVPKPFLLVNHLNLREYQREGVDWLVGMHDRALNGILADEMGLGKTIQTISLLAHLAGTRGCWGPHLVVVPTSVLLNWEMELKRFCPGLKVVSYYGTQKERKAKRADWGEENAFHMCITSYNIAVADCKVLNKRKWYYLILDEAHNIKNFESQRWQTLLTFKTKRRLLLTGTPLQNSLMELWSLMHFLMPHVFQSQHEFKHWFNNPLTKFVESDAINAAASTDPRMIAAIAFHRNVVKRLHGVIRPFLLRRLKQDVLKQLPQKHEHIIMVPLARRQRFLYQDFISRSSTQETLRSGSYVGMMGIMMKLRMVCNHPDLFEARSIDSSLIQAESLSLPFSKSLTRVLRKGPFQAYLKSTLISRDPFFEHANAESDAIALRCLSPRAVSTSLKPPLPSQYQQALDHSMADVVGPRLQDSFLERHRQDLLQQRTQQAKEEMDQRREMNVWRLQEAGHGMEMPLATLTSTQTSVPSCMLISQGVEERLAELDPVLEHFMFITPKVQAPRVRMNHLVLEEEERVQGYKPFNDNLEEVARSQQRGDSTMTFHKLHSLQMLNFPGKLLLQYDCGKLQALAPLLHEKKRQGSRVLIFTQMTKMLNVLELFLNLHGHTYFRLDGSTKVDDRQSMMDRFNRDPKIFCFILSTRSGGLGINLVGADTVVFYDSDWNPSMDAQAQDRAHRIGQTREVHIYRLISEKTIEENILLKANQKRALNQMSLEEGQFTHKSLVGGASNIVQDMKESLVLDKQGSGMEEVLDAQGKLQADEEVTKAMEAVEDEDDVAAIERAREESREDDFMHGHTTPPVPIEQEYKANGVRSKKKSKAGLVLDIGQGSSAGELTMEQFNMLESMLKPVEQYATKFRYPWLIDEKKAKEALDELDELEQAQEWRMEEVEKDKERLENEQAAELMEVRCTKLYSIKDYMKAKHKVQLETLERELLGTGWEATYDVKLQPLYFNVDTNTKTWEKPAILDQREYMEETHAWEEEHEEGEHPWHLLPPSCLVRISQFLATSCLPMQLTCKSWLCELYANPRCALWVGLPDGAFFCTVGDIVMVDYGGNGVWYPASIREVNSDNTYDVVYTDGEKEDCVEIRYIKKDTGSRWIQVEERADVLYKMVGKHHSSRRGLGAEEPDPRLYKTVEEALKASRPGDAIIIKAGMRVLEEEAWVSEKKSVSIQGESYFTWWRRQYHHRRRIFEGCHLLTPPEEVSWLLSIV